MAAGYAIPSSRKWQPPAPSKARPVSDRVRLADIFSRLEFTHGHNMLFGVGLFQLASPMATVRPYVGLGGGVAFPHTEVWFKDEARATQTYEYQ